MEEQLPELPPPAYAGIVPLATCGTFTISLGPTFTAKQMRSYAMQCVLQERERVIEEIEAIITSDRAVNLTAGEIMRNEIAEDLIAAIRKGE